MRTPLAFAAGVVVIALLSGCGFYYHRDKYQKLSSVPTTTTPWRSLSSGVDVHWWFDCYDGSYQNEAPRCTSMNMLLTRSGDAPDWQKIVREGGSHLSLHDRPTIVPLLSAHRDTNHRVLGMRKDKMGLAEIIILRVGADAIAGADKMNSNETVFRKDVWHNATCTSPNSPVPRLVAEDERSIWVFAEAGPGCGVGSADLRAPIDMMAFDHPELYPDLLGKRMLLFYLDWAEVNKADFHEPRMASSNAQLLANMPRTFVNIASVPRPFGKVFTLEDGRIRTALPSTPIPNVQCNYTKIYSGWTILANDTKTRLNGCKPYEATVKGIVP